MVRIGVEENERDAIESLSKSRATNDDILNHLWYLFFQTRSQISGSIREEYFRLSLAENIKIIADGESNSDAARKAYEFVAVASSHDVGLPVEVLVRALRIDYSEFFDLNADGRPLWGLIYESESDSADTVLYQTRNNVVTRVLIEMVNRGSLGVSGQFSVLKELLLACDGGSPVYRRFVEEILVKSRTKLENVYDFEQGLELYDAALLAMQSEDRLLEHHKGIWIQRVGGNYGEAYTQLLKATRRSEHPDQTRPEPVENIHTSLANTIVKRIRAGEEEIDTGLELVEKHIKLAKRPNVFNVHTSHVSAKMFLELAQMEDVVERSASPLHAATRSSWSDRKC